jgi:hypothetical protein
VRDFDGGIAEWERAGLPLESGEAPRGPARDRPAAGKVPFAEAAARWVAGRSFGTLLATWFWINLSCGVLYWAISFIPSQGLREQGMPMAAGANALLEAIYFSFVTGLSIGFGDIVPVGAVRLLAIVQGGGCLLLFGAIISKLVSGRQEELTEEIHRITFEDRLGRVRTNLHLVVSEIQDLTEKCAGGEVASDAVLTRFESAAAIFAGELRAVHDLLYRPQTAPDEDVLESILAHLDGGLREFSTLLSCLSGARRNSQALLTNVRSIAALANEICGECVPREYAPALKAWMDRIQDRSRSLVA